MEYKGMPYSWVDYYKKAFEAVSVDLELNLTEIDITKSCEILKSKNARVVYREIEYTPEEIFTAVTAHWHKKADLSEVIAGFFKGIELKPIIYDDSVACLEYLKEKGFKIAALTDLPTAMPDEFFKKDIIDLIKYFDLYVSSLSCGFRKPNKNGLLYIADYFKTDVEELILIGDEEKDIKTAKNAGCASILIDRNYRENGVKNHGQDFTVYSLEEKELMKFYKGEIIKK